MRIRRPIALILSAALAAGALTGCSWEDFLEWLNSSSSSSPSSQPDSSSSQPDSSSSQVVTDDPSTWPHGDNGQLVAPDTLDALPNNIKNYITGDITGIDLSATQITTIDSNAFLLCGNLQTVTLPNSVGTIERDAFWCCTNLTSINLGDTGIKAIENQTFSLCTSLKTVILPATLKKIGDIAFQGTGLTDLFFTGDVVPTIVKEDFNQMGAFREVDASKNNLTIYYPDTWDEEKIEDLKKKIAASGMIGTPNYSADSPATTSPLLDAARLFGL